MKTIKNNLIVIGICLITFHLRLFSQDATKSIYLSYNLTKTLFNEYSINAEYRPLKRHVFGLTVGKVHVNRNYEVFILSTSQDSFPGLVYNGFVARAAYSYYAKYNNHYAFSLSPQFMFKNLHYDNQFFIDTWGGADKSGNKYIRNEKAQLYGVDFVTGWLLFIGPATSIVKAYLNFNCGVGIRYRHREIETTYSYIYGSPEYVVSLGHETMDQSYIIPLMGIKLGVKLDLLRRAVDSTE